MVSTSAMAFVIVISPQQKRRREDSRRRDRSTSRRRRSTSREREKRRENRPDDNKSDDLLGRQIVDIKPEIEEHERIPAWIRCSPADLYFQRTQVSYLFFNYLIHPQSDCSSETTIAFKIVELPIRQLQSHFLINTYWYH